MSKEKQTEGKRKKICINIEVNDLKNIDRIVKENHTNRNAYMLRKILTPDDSNSNIIYEWRFRTTINSVCSLYNNIDKEKLSEDERRKFEIYEEGVRALWHFLK